MLPITSSQTYELLLVEDVFMVIITNKFNYYYYNFFFTHSYLHHFIKALSYINFI